jgi:hypothetical protein
VENERERKEEEVEEVKDENVKKNGKYLLKTQESLDERERESRYIMNNHPQVKISL